MNNEILNLIKESINREKESNLDELYRTIWINVLMQFKENNKENGVHFWLQKNDDEYYTMFYYGENGITKKVLKMNEDEKGAIEIMLLDDGFEISETKNKNTLLMLDKSTIISYANSQNRKPAIDIEDNKIVTKMPITPFAETRRNVSTVPTEIINMLDDSKIRRR